MKDSGDMDELIGKVLAGEATMAEKDSVDEWIARDEANRRYFEQLKTIFQKSSEAAVSLQFDADVAWQKVKARLPKGAKQIPLQASSPLPLFRIAAALAILVAAGFGVWSIVKPVNQFEEVASGSSTVSDSLPDGSTAFLNRKSKLSFRYNASTKTREAKLTGEAFFEIRHEDAKPFVIQTEDMLIKDIGTAFNVEAWPESHTIEVTVKEGEVQVYTVHNPGMSLHAGEKGIYDKIRGEFSKIQKMDTNVLAYRTKVFTFDNTDLRSVVALISNVYNVNITLSDDVLNSCRVTVNFNNDPLETVIDVLAETMGLKITKKDSQIILTGTGCIK